MTGMVTGTVTDGCRTAVRGREPEQLRWLGVRGLYALCRHADRREDRGLPHTSRFARLATTPAGR